MSAHSPKPGWKMVNFGDIAQNFAVKVDPAGSKNEIYMKPSRNKAAIDCHEIGRAMTRSHNNVETISASFQAVQAQLRAICRAKPQATCAAKLFERRRKIDPCQKLVVNRSAVAAWREDKGNGNNLFFKNVPHVPLPMEHAI